MSLKFSLPDIIQISVKENFNDIFIFVLYDFE